MRSDCVCGGNSGRHKQKVSSKTGRILHPWAGRLARQMVHSIIRLKLCGNSIGLPMIAELSKLGEKPVQVGLLSWVSNNSLLIRGCQKISAREIPSPRGEGEGRGRAPGGGRQKPKNFWRFWVMSTLLFIVMIGRNPEKITRRGSHALFLGHSCSHLCNDKKIVLS